MSSIRTYLIVALLSTITLVNFISALHGYRASMQEAEKLFDRKLADTASLLRDLPLSSTVRAPAATHEEQTVFQITDANGSILWRSALAPDTPLAPLKAGYGEYNFSGFRWRTLARFSDAQQRWTLVAERMDVRYLLAEKIILESVLPIVFTLPLAGILIWLIVGHGLKNLKQLARELRYKRADDLSPLRLTEPPRELEPVIQSTNFLLERLRASFERERRFASDAAHELRTPLSGLRLHLHNLRREMAEPSESLQQLDSDVDRMTHLVEQILALYRTTPDHYPTQFEQLDLFQLARDTIAENYHLFDARQQAIELKGETAVIAGDRFALGMLLQNLLSNANKYTPEGGQIELCVEPDAQNVVLTVSDSGPGITPEEQTRVFERFYRVGGDRHNTGVSGCGLGLSIVDHIAQLHRARIRLATSHWGQGLSVQLRFPRTQPDTSG